ncbi:MAG: class I SAM-dependent methyltransferase [Isosphaeraceae bacterium]
MRLVTNPPSLLRLWTLVQEVLGAPRFKGELYRSKLNPPGNLLDFGCANGHLSDAFSEFEYYGVDLDSVAIEAAKARFHDKTNMHFMAVDLRTRPFPRGFFDEILFAGTVHHLDDELLEILLTEMNYCLKPGGTVHLIDPVFQDSDRWSQKLMRRIDRGRYTRTAAEILAIIGPLGLFECGITSFHRPYGALLRDCDFLYLPLTKGGERCP